jgi:polyphenol oxidase
MFGDSPVIHGITTRTDRLPMDGNMSLAMGGSTAAVIQNRQAWAEEIGYDWRRFTVGRQVHETSVALVNETVAGAGSQSLETALQRVDALITNQPDVPIAVMAADCVPLLVYDPISGAIGAIHAGWRGTVTGIAENTIRSMQTAFGSRVQDLLIGIGPAICRRCYQVGTDVVDAWRSNTFSSLGDPVEQQAGDYYFDLIEANRIQLIASGVEPSNIEYCGVCTKCSNGSIFSRRGLGPKTGLFASVIMLEK